MKSWIFHVAQNAGEYFGWVRVSANQLTVEWSSDEAKERAAYWNLDHDGDVIIADGVRIEFDESFEFSGKECTTEARDVR